jgi:hypothetical protein
MIFLCSNNVLHWSLFFRWSSPVLNIFFHWSFPHFSLCSSSSFNLSRFSNSSPSVLSVFAHWFSLVWSIFFHSDPRLFYACPHANTLLFLSWCWADPFSYFAQVCWLCTCSSYLVLPSYPSDLSCSFNVICDPILCSIFRQWSSPVFPCSSFIFSFYFHSSLLNFSCFLPLFFQWFFLVHLDTSTFSFSYSLTFLIIILNLLWLVLSMFVCMLILSPDLSLVFTYILHDTPPRQPPPVRDPPARRAANPW